MIPKNKTEKIQILAINSSNAGLTGLTVTLTIKRASDNYFWNGSAFQSGAVTVAMSAIDATNLPGVYEYDFNMSGLSEDRYSLYSTTSGAAVNKPWSGTINTGLNDISTADIAAISTAGASEATIAGDVSLAKKMLYNNKVKSGQLVEVKENDASTELVTYKVTASEQTKQ